MLEATLGMNKLYECKKQKGKHIIKWLYIKNRNVFIRRFKEKFGNDKTVLKNFIRIYLQGGYINITNTDSDKFMISSILFCGQYLKNEQDINYGLLEEREGAEGTQIHFS